MLLGEERSSTLVKRCVPELMYRPDYTDDIDSDGDSETDDIDEMPVFQTIPGLPTSPQVTIKGAIALINK